MRLLWTRLALDVVRKSSKDCQQKKPESTEREGGDNEIWIAHTKEVVEEDRDWH